MGLIVLQAPQAGLPNATEDPKITADMVTLQTLLNGNMDTNNLSPSAAITVGQMAAGATRFVPIVVNSATNAADGQLLLATGTCTITLPAPAAGTHIKVLVAYAATAGAPVALSPSAGLIYGRGASGSGPITLGSSGAVVELIGDGVNFAIVSGCPDSGWVALSAGTGITLLGAVAKLVGTDVRLRGALENSSGGTISLNATIATVPSFMFPPATYQGSGLRAAGGVAVDSLQILGTGQLQDNSSSIANTGTIALDQLAYSISA